MALLDARSLLKELFQSGFSDSSAMPIRLQKNAILYAAMIGEKSIRDASNHQFFQQSLKHARAKYISV